MKNPRLDEATIRGFWESVAEKRGGEAAHRSFCRYLGSSERRAQADFSGLIYTAGGKLWFETVESQSRFMGFPALGNLSKEKYEYLELGIPLEDIAGAVRVASGDANACMTGRGQDLKPLSILGGFFDRPVMQIRLRGGYSEFFEVDRDKELAAALLALIEVPSPGA
jgi:hypothetical protein